MQYYFEPNYKFCSMLLFLCSDLFRLPKIRKRIVREERAIAAASDERRAKRREHEAIGQKRLGPQRYSYLNLLSCGCRFSGGILLTEYVSLL